jgi:broad specificity phosphatase PhoE
MKVYFIRHGQTTCNAAETHQGWGPISLSEKGFMQAAAIREYLEPINFDKIYASDLLRTRQTTEVLFPEEYRSGEINFDADIREIDTGALYGRLSVTFIRSSEMNTHITAAIWIMLLSVRKARLIFVLELMFF